MKKLVMIALVVVMSLAAVLGIAACNKTELVGFDVELAKAVGDYLGVKVEFQEINWDQKETELESKNIDLLWNGVSINPERIEAWEMSGPYMLNEQVAIIRKSDKDKYDTLDKMKSTTEWIAEGGSEGKKVIESLGITPKQAEAQINILTELKSGTIDIGVMDKVMAGYYINQSGSSYSADLMIADVKLAESEYYGIACRKGEKALMDKINTALAAKYKDGTMTDIAEKYGLAEILIPYEYESQWDSIENKADWDYIVSRGSIKIGYTLFAPMNFKAKV
ncbi:MAG: transporter substrate-binding domain-containing protein [Clostridia bacterium]|nr:transporter substrate-binding domain-containing protein [Clostridia bacterium]